MEKEKEDDECERGRQRREAVDGMEVEKVVEEGDDDKEEGRRTKGCTSKRR